MSDHTVSAFVEAALSDAARAGPMLAARPDLADADLHAALVLGDIGRVERAIAGAPTFVRDKAGPRQWEPLLYVCFSRFADRNSARAGAMVDTAKVLLAAGANPDATCIHADWPEYPLSCLYGATGLNNNPPLALALLEAGANPNDNESLYHSTEHPDLECVRLLLAHGASPHRTNALRHMLDREDVDGVRLLLSAGADPNEKNAAGETSLHWAVWRGRGPAVVAALIDGGADLDARRRDGRTAYAMAVQRGQQDIADLLAQRGASTDVSALDRLLGACMQAAPGDFERLIAGARGLSLSSHEQRLLADLAMSHSTAGVRAMLELGCPVDARGEHGATGLHWACWKGYPDLVQLLLERGAPLTVEDWQFHSTPPGWFGHGVRNCGEPGADYPAVARLLLDAGATLRPEHVPTGDAAVDAVLRERGVIA